MVLTIDIDELEDFYLKMDQPEILNVDDLDQLFVQFLEHKATEKFTTEAEHELEKWLKSEGYIVPPRYVYEGRFATEEDAAQAFKCLRRVMKQRGWAMDLDWYSVANVIVEDDCFMNALKNKVGWSMKNDPNFAGCVIRCTDSEGKEYWRVKLPAGRVLTDEDMGSV